MQDIFSLKGKNAVVIGGGGGIGQELAKGLAFYGANVAIASRSMDTLTKAAEAIEAEIGKKVQTFTVDSSDEESIKALVKTVVEKMGTPHILVNSQGYNVKSTALEFKAEEWEKIYKVNVEGVLFCCREFAKEMIPNKYGRIINISSIRGTRALDMGNSGYGSSKGGQDMLTQYLAVEWAKHNVTVNAIAPALTYTGMVAKMMDNDPEGRKRYESGIPLKRLGTPQDCVGACVLLSSEAGSFITGQIIHPNGGMTII